MTILFLSYAWLWLKETSMYLKEERLFLIWHLSATAMEYFVYSPSDFSQSYFTYILASLESVKNRALLNTDFVTIL
jgi:hypothetical protein